MGARSKLNPNEHDTPVRVGHRWPRFLAPLVSRAIATERTQTRWGPTVVAPASSRCLEGRAGRTVRSRTGSQPVHGSRLVRTTHGSERRSFRRSCDPARVEGLAALPGFPRTTVYLRDSFRVPESPAYNRAKIGYAVGRNRLGAGSTRGGSPSLGGEGRPDTGWKPVPVLSVLLPGGAGGHAAAARVAAGAAGAVADGGCDRWNA
jgi:hypothetical protein